MLRTVATIFALVLAVLPSLGAAGSIADDPRVVDAVTAWETWVEYQLATQRIPGAATGVVQHQGTKMFLSNVGNLFLFKNI